jgi:hypothetical protein
MSEVVGHKRNVKQQCDRSNPSVSHFYRIAVFVRVADDFCPNFAKFFVGMNEGKIAEKFSCLFDSTCAPIILKFPAAQLGKLHK